MGMLPDYPRLKRRLNSKFEEMIRKEMKKDPFLAQIRKHEIHEGNSLTAKSLDGYSSTTRYQEIASEFKISTDEIIKHGPDAFFSRATETSKDMVRKLSQHTIGVLDRIIERTGNVVKTKGGAVTPHSILDAIEKMEISFDESGKPIMPVIVMAPDEFEKIKGNLKEWEPDPELEKRRKEIIEKKRKQWIDRENCRKLVD